MRNDQNEEEIGASKRIIFTYPMVAQTDMTDQMKTEVLELCTNACEKHVTSNELAAQMIKEALDMKYGSTWHVIVGEGFSFDITYEISKLFYMFFAGNLGIIAWKCSPYGG